jgi:hypothetical protein
LPAHFNGLNASSFFFDFHVSRQKARAAKGSPRAGEFQVALIFRLIRIHFIGVNH